MTRAHLWSIECILILVGFGNAQHLSELHKIMYTGVAFTLEMMGLIPHKIITLGKVFLSLICVLC